MCPVFIQYFSAALQHLNACGALLEREASSVAPKMPERGQDSQLLDRGAERPADTHLPDLHGLDARFFEREYRAVPLELGKLPQAATQEAIEEAAETCTSALEVLPSPHWQHLHTLLSVQCTAAVVAHCVKNNRCGVPAHCLHCLAHTQSASLYQGLAAAGPGWLCIVHLASEQSVQYHDMACAAPGCQRGPVAACAAELRAVCGGHRRGLRAGGRPHHRPRLLQGALCATHTQNGVLFAAVRMLPCHVVLHETAQSMPPCTTWFASSMDARVPFLPTNATPHLTNCAGALRVCCMPEQEARANLGLARKSVAVGTWVAKRSRRKQVRRRSISVTASL